MKAEQIRKPAIVCVPCIAIVNGIVVLIENLNYLIIKKMGGADCCTRFIVAMVAVILYWQGIIEGTLAYVMY